MLKLDLTLAMWLSWLERHPIHQKVEGSIPSQGIYLGCGFDSWLWHILKAVIDICLSHLFLFFLSLSLSLSLFLSSIKINGNISLGEDFIKYWTSYLFIGYQLFRIYYGFNRDPQKLKRKRLYVDST